MKNQYRSMLLGGLLTKGIKAAYKELRKRGARSSREIMKKEGVDRKTAKDDIKSGIRNELLGKLKTTKDKLKKRLTISDINKLR
tara:strand:- start:3 stop:254 length:252 start_codon:yes stop_codon:yes gene_type:complete